VFPLKERTKEQVKVLSNDATAVAAIFVSESKLKIKDVPSDENIADLKIGGKSGAWLSMTTRETVAGR